MSPICKFRAEGIPEIIQPGSPPPTHFLPLSLSSDPWRMQEILYHKQRYGLRGCWQLKLIAPRPGSRLGFGVLKLPCASTHVEETTTTKKFATNSGEALAATCSSRSPRQNSRFKSDTHGPGGDQRGQLRLKGFDRKSWREGE